MKMQILHVGHNSYPRHVTLLSFALLRSATNFLIFQFHLETTRRVLGKICVRIVCNWKESGEHSL